MEEERRTIKAWVHKLGEPDGALTLAELEAYMHISAQDRLVEMRDLLQDLHMRLLRLETYVDAKAGDYTPTIRKALHAGGEA